MKDDTTEVQEFRRAIVNADHEMFVKRLDTAIYLFWRDSRFPDGKVPGWDSVRGNGYFELTSTDRLIVRVIEYRTGVQDVEVYRLADDLTTLNTVEWFAKWLRERFGAVLAIDDPARLYTWTEPTAEQMPPTKRKGGRPSPIFTDDPFDSLFLPLTPGVEFLEMETSRLHLLQALLLALNGHTKMMLWVDQWVYRVEWEGLWFLEQDPTSWPNPVLIQVNIREDGQPNNKRVELARFEILEDAPNRARMAINGNRNLIRTTAARFALDLVVQTWLKPWLPSQPADQDEQEPPPTIKEFLDNIPYEKGTKAFYDEFRRWHNEGGKDTGTQKEFARQLGITERGLRKQLAKSS